MACSTWEAWVPVASAPSVGTQDSATNLTVQSTANSLGAMGSIRDRASTLGSLQRITQGSQDVWEAQRSSTGHRLPQISDQNTTWTILREDFYGFLQKVSLIILLLVSLGMIFQKIMQSGKASKKAE